METRSGHRTPWRPPPHACRRALVVGLWALFLPVGLEAQAEADRSGGPPAAAAPAALEGTVLSAAGAVGEAADAPVAGAEVWILGTGVGTLTDGEGRFRLAGLPPGRYRLLVGAEGHREAVADVDVAAGETGTLRVALESADAELERRAAALRADAGTTRGRSGARGFRERMEGGLGQYVTKAEIDAADVQRLSEVIRRYTNVEVRPCSEGGGGSGGSCYWVVTGTRLLTAGGVGGSAAGIPGDGGGTMVSFLRSKGSEHGAAGKPCLASVYLDGAPMDQEMHPNGIDAVSPSQLEAVEVYRRGALAPARFRSVGGCGVVLLWSRGAGGSGTG